MKFDAPKEMSSIIKVLGVGGGGSNAVNHMFNQGIKGVDFIVCNTDSQALDLSPIPNKIQLGSSLTEGRGAGSVPEVGKNSAIENIEELRNLLEKNTKMLFITAGMGGGTGTGAAPVIAAISKELGILTVAIVTIPFSFEGRKRRMQAEQGIEELRKNVDTLLVISNDKLRELYGNLAIYEAFGKADNILTNAAKGIAEIITVPGYLNVDFEDVKTVMKNSGVAIMGTGIASGENRAHEAVEMALSSPLLNDSQIIGANNILLYISTGTDDIRMDELSEITNYIQEEAGLSAEIIWGTGKDESLGENVNITIIATGFKTENSVDAILGSTKRPEKHVVKLDVENEIEKNPPKKVEIEEVEMQLFIRPVMETPEPKKPDYLDEIIRNSPTSINSPTENKSTFIVHTLDADEGAEPETITRESINSEIVSETKPVEAPKQTLNFSSKVDERIQKLKNLSLRLKNPELFKEIEQVPAYMRRGVSLNETLSSKSENISRYSLDGETGEIKSNNSFLHDNVD
ncbi:MAG: cell division protein FtsZ [Bacteroidetes bacterium CG2_30_33_31]|nr:MAG: cell division protein FtsZ [Bacteroidetes bacterium CG2_30_33_31]